MMIRQFAVLGVALGFTALGVRPASAVTTFDTSAASIQCDTIIATGTTKPPVSAASTGSAEVKVKGTLSGCQVTGAVPPGLVVVSGTIKGTLDTTGSPGCAGLLSPATIAGGLTVKWKVATGQKLDFPSSTANGGTVTGGIFAGPSTASYGKFTLSGQTLASGSAFAGGTPSTVAVTSEDIGNLGLQCAGAGVKTIHLSVGTTIL